MSRLLAVLLLFVSTAWAAPGIERSIPALDIRALPPLDPADPAWARIAPTSVRLYPQTTVACGPDGVVQNIEASVLKGGGQIAVRFSWPDATQNSADAKSTHLFADAVAVQFAPAGETLPYVGMGEPERPVQLWLWRAGRAAERLSARGFGSLAQAPGAAPEVRARRTAAGWLVVMRGDMDADSSALAFAVWDGARDERACRKQLSAWQALAWPGGSPRLLEELRDTGNPGRGARLYVEHGCAACHAPTAAIGPDLSHAGGIHWPGYLRRAIREPSAFLVPGYGAIMPTLPLQADDIDDLVAYLTSLR